MSLTIFANDEPAEPPRKDDEPGNPGGATVLEAKPKTKKPSMYKVLLLNDDYTPMEVVVDVLERFFNMNAQSATQVMLHVHQQGVGVRGVYTFEVAETKINYTVCVWTFCLYFFILVRFYKLKTWSDEKV